MGTDPARMPKVISRGGPVQGPYPYPPGLGLYVGNTLYVQGYLAHAESPRPSVGSPQGHIGLLWVLGGGASL